MRIGIAGPMTLTGLPLDPDVRCALPAAPYENPMTGRLVAALLTRGHEVVAFTTAADAAAPIVLRQASPPLTVCIAPHRDRHAARDFYRHERAALVALMRAHPVDVLNAHWTYEFAAAALAADPDALITLRDHAPTVLRYVPDAHRLMRLLLSAWVLHGARHLSVNSDYLFALLSPRQRRKARVIANFYDADLTRWRRPAPPRPPPEAPVILTIAHGFDHRKNVGTALHAFARLRLDRPNARLRLVGSDMQAGGPCAAYAARHSLAASVDFLGFRPYVDTLDAIAQADVLLHPAREESFGMAPLEAMVIGTPVVGGRASGNIPYLLDHGRAGQLCDVNDADAMADAVARTLDDRTATTAMVEHARRFAEDRFSEAAAVRSYETWYEEACARRAAGTPRATGAAV